MAYFVIIRGHLGCGKTMIAKALAKNIGAKYFSIDDILEKDSLDEIDERLGCVPPENFKNAQSRIMPDAEKLLAGGKPVVFDGCFYHREQIEQFRDGLNYPDYVFTLKAPLEVCIERDRKRKKSYGKLAAKAVYNLVTKFDYGISVGATQEPEKVVRQIESLIGR